ncbi:hypothetical protein [Inconstantimicrobium mannanitabidum]|uniref:Uncharacterized protein n=1 Tax=Inconstantimicrobium mannanitabidum TaxID=1604901 RepID=A0ACB5RDK7_9CLOT|nr:hypothetical protein [Clostridium sp. TW13]GKX66984.1 hypothetical protein rsdtw13_22420 [Clostridium sp. TW13]
MNKFLKIATVFLVIFFIIAVVLKLIQVLLPIILILILVGYIYSKFIKRPISNKKQESDSFSYGDTNNRYESDEDKYSNKKVVDVEYKDLD